MQAVKARCCQHLPDSDVVLLPLDLLGGRWVGRGRAGRDGQARERLWRHF